MRMNFWRRSRNASVLSTTPNDPAVEGSGAAIVALLETLPPNTRHVMNGPLLGQPIDLSEEPFTASVTDASTWDIPVLLNTYQVKNCFRARSGFGKGRTPVEALSKAIADFNAKGV